MSDNRFVPPLSIVGMHELSFDLSHSLSEFTQHW